MREELEPNIEKNLNKLKEQLNEIRTEDSEQYIGELIKIIEDIDNKENKLDILIKERNELQELENQLRHVRKKSEAYNIKEYEKSLKVKYNNLTSENLKKRINHLAKNLIILDNEARLKLWDRIISLLFLRKRVSELKQEGILMHLLLEEYYLTTLVEERKEKFERENFEELKNEIKKLYIEKYIPTSQNVLNQVIKKNINSTLIENILEKIELGKHQEPTEENPMPIIKNTKNSLLELYPIVLTTVDSVISNYFKYFDTNIKVDYIIIDESSQCDILSALPLLYLAKNIIVVGDEKQLSAITNINNKDISYIVDDEYDYTKENFLSTISKTIHPVNEMLLEHYRCDYNIINYCNKFFYNNKLKIYRDAKKGAMSLINNDKGKYVEEGDGYQNQREIKCIDEVIENNIENKFIITPFRVQADILRGKYGEKQCGTIHTFQGKGEKQVYFSSVLNKTEKCIRHLNGENNLFTRELINVAVSRAKEKFILVSDVEFFRKYDSNMKNLIEYIEIYGDKIPDKTVCIFDYLYKQIPIYQKTIPNIDNPYEEKVYHLLVDYLKNKDGKYKMVWKLPLAEFVTDKNYLNANKDKREFILHNSHLDFCLYTDNINKPVLAIEVDGKYHKLQPQKTRDGMKEEILEYMGIPLLRIPSKVTWKVNEFEDKIEEKLKM